MIAKVYSAIPEGFNGRIIEVEGNTTKNLPCFNIVGMANKTITEARERVRSAITNSNLTFPVKKVTVNLAPADVIKSGSHLDLAIAVNILILSKHLLQKDVDSCLFVGELSLDGRIKPVHGIINVVEAAVGAGFSKIFVPSENLAQASLIEGVDLYGVNTLEELLHHLRGITPVAPAAHVPVSPNTAAPSPPKPSSNTASDIPSFSQIYGQDLAKRALTIALAGHHNILLSGPPGAGKTMLARAAASLLPPPSLTEQISITKLHSLGHETDSIVTTRPYRSPHHTASIASVIGGGPQASPGEISLAHHGILFLDELPEFPRAIIESLRQPLEDHSITITRVGQKSTYPASFILIATMNPCPCGYNGDPAHTCSCTEQQIKNYHDRISGPILDRIDLCVNVKRTPNASLISSLDSISPEDVVKNTRKDNALRESIKNCHELQMSRFKGAEHNGTAPIGELTKLIDISPAAKDILGHAIDSFSLSARSYFKVIRVATTIADLENSAKILPEHISEALSYRFRSRSN